MSFPKESAGVPPSVSSQPIKALSGWRFQAESSYRYELPVALRAASSSGHRMPGDLIWPEESRAVWISLPSLARFSLCSWSLFNRPSGLGLLESGMKGQQKTWVQLEHFSVNNQIYFPLI